MTRMKLTALLTGVFAATAFATVAVADDRSGRYEGHHAKKHAFMAERMAQIDTDGDGKVSEAEMTTHKTAITINTIVTVSSSIGSTLSTRAG